MKTVYTLLVLLTTIALTSFNKPQAHTHKTWYAYATGTERDKSLDDAKGHGYVDLTTNIVSYTCSHGHNEVARQFMKHYEAEEKTTHRDLEYNFPVSAWVYNSYDEALESRREWLAKANAKHKRRIEKFYVTCK
jgi:4-aminobutyrate aminotransferase-like enzyme